MITWKLIVNFLVILPWVLGWRYRRKAARAEPVYREDFTPPPLRHEVNDIQRKLEKLSRAQR